MWRNQVRPVRKCNHTISVAIVARKQGRLWRLLPTCWIHVLADEPGQPNAVALREDELDFEGSEAELAEEEVIAVAGPIHRQSAQVHKEQIRLGLRVTIDLSDDINFELNTLN